MSRSTKKGPYVDPKLVKKLSRSKSGDGVVIKTWSRDSEISPEMVGYIFGVHNGKNFIEADSKQIVLASAEQVAEIQRLVSVLNVSEEEIEKVLTKSGADKWEELSNEQAVDMIKRLNKKITGGK